MQWEQPDVFIWRGGGSTVALEGNPSPDVAVELEDLTVGREVQASLKSTFPVHKSFLILSAYQELSNLICIIVL